MTDIVPGGSSAKINADRNTPMNNNKRGFRHVYKSTTTNSSRRVHAANKTCATNGTPRSQHAKRRDKGKTKKIASLEQVSSSPVHSLGKPFLNTQPVFYSGTGNRMLPNPITNGIMLSAVKDLKVVNTVFGARLESASGDTVFTLIPRHASIQDMTRVQDILTSLHALDKGKGAPEVRGKTRIAVAEDDGKYTTVGLKPNQSSTGITESWPKKLSQVDRDRIKKLMRRCEEVAKGYVLSNEVRGL
jgi:hypothetical protein